MSGTKGKSGRSKEFIKLSPKKKDIFVRQINHYLDEWKKEYAKKNHTRATDALIAEKIRVIPMTVSRFRKGEITEANLQALCKLLRISRGQLLFDSYYERFLYDEDLARDRVNQLQEYAQSIDLPDCFLDLLITEFPANLLRLIQWSASGMGNLSSFNRWDAFDLGNAQEISVPSVAGSSLQVHEDGRTHNLHKSDLDSYKLIYDYVIEFLRLLLQERKALHEINQLKRAVGMLLPNTPTEEIVDHAMNQIQTLSREDVTRIVDAYRDKKALAEIYKNDDAISDILESRRTTLKSETDKLMAQTLAALNKATKEKPSLMVVEGIFGKYRKEG